MQPGKADASYLWEMLDAAKAAQKFVFDKEYEDYATHRMLRGAVERQLEIIGAAAAQVSDEFRQAHPEIPWRLLIERGDALIRQYHATDHLSIWKVATLELGELVGKVELLIPTLPQLESY